MEIFLDTANVEEIKEILPWGIISAWGKRAHSLSSHPQVGWGGLGWGSQLQRTNPILIETAGPNRIEGPNAACESTSAAPQPPRVWRHFDPAERSRTCRICRIKKPLEHFEKTSPYNGHVYRRRICRECRKPSVRTLQKGV